MSRCGKRNGYRIEINKKAKTFHANMLKKYVESADQNEAAQQNSDNNQTMSCNVCTAIIGGNEDLSVNDDKMMEWANCHQKETVQETKLPVDFTIFSSQFPIGAQTRDLLFQVKIRSAIQNDF